MSETKNPFGTREEMRLQLRRWRLLNQLEIDDRRRETADEKLRALNQLYAFAREHGVLPTRDDEPRRPVLPVG
ncbi:MAG: hypothetical protein WD557_04065 [Dehalococcoidia bacterium]